MSSHNNSNTDQINAKSVAKKAAKMHGFIEGSTGFETAVKLFTDGLEYAEAHRNPGKLRNKELLSSYADSNV